MPAQKVVLATTKPIGGMQFSREALMSGVASINGQRAARQMLEHDPYYVPLGKIRDAQLKDVEGESILMAVTDDSHLTTTMVHEPTGKRIVQITFPNDSRPFLLQGTEIFKTELTVAVDNANFDSNNNFDKFLNSVEAQEDGEEATTTLVRRSLTPEPLVQFAIAHPELVAALTWLFLRGEKFVSYTIDATARRVGDALAERLSKKLTKWLGIYHEHRSSDDRPVTIHVILNAQIQIHLLTRIQAQEESTGIALGSLCEQMELYQDLLTDADSVTFGRTGSDEEWELLYITTKSGNVLTTENCYEATTARLYEIARTIPVCLCLTHKETGEQLHYETTARITPLDEQGRFRFVSNSIPKDFDQWELTNVSLLLGEETDDQAGDSKSERDE